MKRILFIDDEPEIQIVVKARLEDLGYKVLAAKDGQEGLALARTESPDAILLDLMLPKLDGFKVCRMLKFDKTYDHIPIVIFSAKGSESDKKLAAEAGADAYMVKPFDFKLCIQTLEKFLGPNVA